MFVRSPKVKKEHRPALWVKLLAVAAIVLIGQYYIKDTRERIGVASTQEAPQTIEKEAADEGVFTSPAGLKYGADPNPRFEDRLAHVMAHTQPDESKPIHSVFIEKTQPGIIALLDEAWQQRGPPSQQGGVQGRDVYDVDMGRVIGEQGQRILRLVTERDSPYVITAYPLEEK